jgi:hypothetical protein
MRRRPRFIPEARLINLARVHDESFWRAPNIIERIASHKCQIAPGSPRQHANIGRPHDLGFRDGIPRCACRSLQVNDIVRMYGAQRTEIGVAMGGDSDVTAAGPKRCARNMSRSLSQDSCVIAFENHHG